MRKQTQTMTITIPAEVANVLKSLETAINIKDAYVSEMRSNTTNDFYSEFNIKIAHPKQTEPTYLYAFINDGHFSGKHPFVYGILNGCIPNEETAQLIEDGALTVLFITQDEYEYIKSIPNDIEVLYNEYGETKEQKFFY